MRIPVAPSYRTGLHYGYPYLYGYRSDMHNLARLINLCRCFSDEPFELFPRKTAEERRLFQILIRSYSETRYKDEYQLNSADAEKLFTQVVEFLKLIKAFCNKRLEQYRQIAEAPETELEPSVQQ